MRRFTVRLVACMVVVVSIAVLLATIPRLRNALGLSYGTRVGHCSLSVSTAA